MKREKIFVIIEILLVVLSIMCFEGCHLLYGYSIIVKYTYFFGVWISMNLIVDVLLTIAFSFQFLIIIFIIVNLKVNLQVDLIEKK